jgi:hypothetical protein
MQERHEKALAALMSEITIRGAAAKLGIGETTLHMWLKDPMLAEAYKEARLSAIEQAIAMLSKMTTKATERVYAILVDDDQPATAHLAAAKLVLEYGFRGEAILTKRAQARQFEEAVESSDWEIVGR